MPSLFVLSCALIFPIALVQSTDKTPEIAMNRPEAQRPMIEGQIIDPETKQPSWLVMLDADPRVTEPARARTMIHEVEHMLLAQIQGRCIRTAS